MRGRKDESTSCGLSALTSQAQRTPPPPDSNNRLSNCSCASSFLTTSQIMQGWNKLQTSLSGLQLGEGASKFAKGFGSTVQATKCALSAFLLMYFSSARAYWTDDVSYW